MGPPDSPAPPGNTRVQLELPVRTILRVLGAALLVWCLLKLRPELIFLTISVLLAIALEPLVRWLGRHRINRSWSVALLAVFGVALIAAFVLLALPPMASQLVQLVKDLPQVVDRLRDGDNPLLNRLADQIVALPKSPDLTSQLGKPLLWGESALSGVVTVAIVFVLTLYFLLDGKRLYAWLLAFVPRRHREKMARTIEEVSTVIHAWIRGQAIACLLFSVFVVIVLSAFRVPLVLPLAVLAFLCDVVPVVGIIIATLPAVLLALTVSPTVALAVAALYLAYHQLETYVIIPRLYGKMMRLSTLTVLLALVIGGALLGIVGAVLALPFVAAYPIVERIWLERYFADEVLEDHRALDTQSKQGKDRAVDKVLQGEEHPDEHAPRH